MLTIFFSIVKKGFQFYSKVDSEAVHLGILFQTTNFQPQRGWKLDDFNFIRRSPERFALRGSTNKVSNENKTTLWVVLFTISILFENRGAPPPCA